MGFLNYGESVRRALDYIEENLSNTLAVGQIAKAAGYSKYHFVRVFTEEVGVTPADYIRKRRLSEIAGKLDGHTGSIAELAFEYGFNSKENFVRAFKAEHAVLPTEYRKVQNSLRLYPKSEKKRMPEPKFVELAPFSLTVFDSDEDFPPRFWNKYNCRGFSKRLSGGKVVPDFGVSEWDIPTQTLHYSIGIRTEEALGDTAGTRILPVRGGIYAVFATAPASHFDFVDTIQNTWKYINTRWLPESGFVRTGGCEFETYVETSRTYSEEIYIPVQWERGGALSSLSDKKEENPCKEERRTE